MASLQDRVLRQVAVSGPYHGLMALLRDVAEYGEAIGFADITNALHSLSRQNLVVIRQRGDSIRTIWAKPLAYRQLGIPYKPEKVELGSKEARSFSTHPADPTDFRIQPSIAPTASDVLITKPDGSTEVREATEAYVQKVHQGPHHSGEGTTYYQRTHLGDKATVNLLQELRRVGDGHTVNELAELLGGSRSNTSMRIISLENRGFVRKVRDGHAYRVVVTLDGVRFLQERTSERPIAPSAAPDVPDEHEDDTPRLWVGRLSNYPQIIALLNRKANTESVINAAAALDKAGLHDLADQALKAFGEPLTELETEVLSLCETLGLTVGED